MRIGRLVALAAFIAAALASGPAVAGGGRPSLARYVRLPGCEPVCLRQVYRVERTGRSYFYQWMVVSEPGPSLAGRVSDGFLDAASVRIYRPAGRAFRKVDTGTVGLFRGTRNGWLTSGHGGKMTRGVGDNPPVGPDEPVILLREDWLDLEPDDIVVVERRAGTTDGRILNALALGDDALPWTSPDEHVDIDLVVHDPRALAATPDWTTPGQGCLRIDNTAGKAAASVHQPPGALGPQAGAMSIGLWARAETRDGSDARIALRWGDGEPVALTVSGTWARHVATLRVDEGQDERDLSVTVPPRCTLWLDQFTSSTHPLPVAPGKTYAPLQAGPSAASIDALLGPAPSTTVAVDPEEPARGQSAEKAARSGSAEKAARSGSAKKAARSGSAKKAARSGSARKAARSVSAKSLRLRSAAVETLPAFLARRAAISDEEIVLALGPLHDEQSWRNLVEYLAAPYDPDRDTPRTKPYAHRRAVCHGRAAPWTGAFGAIVIDVAPRWPDKGPAGLAASRLSGHVAGHVLPETPYWRAAGGRLRATISRARPGPSTASTSRLEPRESGR
jgi:hypothetical protein